MERGSPSAPRPQSRRYVMVMPAVHRWAGRLGLSTSVPHVLCQALGHRREWHKEVLPEEDRAKKGQHLEIQEKSVTGRGHSKARQAETRVHGTERPTQWS